MADDNHGSGIVDPGRSTVRLQDDLAWDATAPRHPVVVHCGEPIASFECRLPEERRIITRLEFLGGRRGVDVSVQPDTIVHLLRRLAMRRNNNSDAWQRALRRQLLASADDWGLVTSIKRDDSLGEMIAVLGFPLVEMAMTRGVRPPPYIPRWAERVLGAPDPRTGARAVFGGRSSRRVARSLAASLVRCGEQADGAGRADAPIMILTPLALAVALPEAASSDVIANVLDAPTAHHAPQHWPSVDEVEMIRRGFRLIGPEASARLALEAMELLDGPRTLAALMAHVPRLLSSHNRPCPRRLGQLEEVVDEFVHEPVEMARRVDRPPPAQPQAAERVAAHRDGGGIDLPVQPLYAPGTRMPVVPGDEFEYPDVVLRLHGATCGEHSLSLPRSRAELTAWAAELSNCMADYCDHVASNRAVILGLRRRGRLVAGVELTRDLRRVRQFVRDGNQRPWRAERDALRDMLVRLGVAGG